MKLQYVQKIRSHANQLLYLFPLLFIASISSSLVQVVITGGTLSDCKEALELATRDGRCLVPWGAS